ncbi:TPA: ead/Ea22-like family protein [Escherichia coli]|uniref:ead/Ea22-like family protein n=1 Tax=Escherichia coli TaxID=562 RepID=UPI001FCEA7FE|nr:ead/Ea22-like family protein [Escherichia coli]
MSKINYQALREAAEKAGEDKWQAKKINGDFFVIRHGSYTRQHGYTSYQPIAEIDCKPVRDFVAKANPAIVLELLDELEAAKKRIAELESNEVLEVGNQFLVVRHPGKTPVIKHCTGDLEEFLRKLIEQDPLVTIDIITHQRRVI